MNMNTWKELTMAVCYIQMTRDFQHIKQALMGGLLGRLVVSVLNC